MAAIKRSADVVWEGTIARGGGRLSGGSGAFAALPVTAASRFGEPEGKTTPEELIPKAKASSSPGRSPRSVIVPFCQRNA